MNAPQLAEATIKLSIPIVGDMREVLVALLADAGAHGFEETRQELVAYWQEGAYAEAAVNAVLERYAPGLVIGRERMEPQDWNAVWEENYDSVLVDDFVEVHPPFREPTPGIAQHIVLTPRMAFGTGHHATTWLVLQRCRALSFEGVDVLDMGCGTAVLGILAAKLGARLVTAIDIDPWSHENALENAANNGVKGMEVIIGDAKAIPDRCYGIILANINRNVLLADRDAYVGHLAQGGQLVLSGIMEKDEDMVTRHYSEAGLRLVARNARNEWIMLAFNKEGE